MEAYENFLKLQTAFVTGTLSWSDRTLAETVNTAGAQPTSLQRLEDLRTFLGKTEPCAVKALMLKHGADPADGWALVLNSKHRADFGPLVPEYLIFSDYVTQPAVMNRKTLGIPFGGC